MQDTAEESRERRLRETAKRQGLRVEQCRRKDPRAYGYGTFHVIDPYRNGVVVAGNPTNGYGLSLDEVEDFLEEEAA